MTTTSINNTASAAPSVATSLGEARRTYSQSTSYKMGLLTAPIIMGVLALASLFVLRPMLVNGFGPFASFSQTGLDIATYSLILPGIFGLATLVQLFRLRGSWGTSVTVHQNGLAFRQGAGKRQEWLWQDVRGLQEQIIQHSAYGVVTVATTYTYWLTNRAGQTLVLDQNMGNLQELIAEIRKAINPLLFNKAAEAYRQGHTSLFGIVGLSQEGLSCNGKTFAWDQIAEIEVNNGRLHISPKNGGFFSTAAADTRQIESLEVLLTLIQEVKKLQA